MSVAPSLQDRGVTLELSRKQHQEPIDPTRAGSRWDGSKVEALFVNLFLEAHPQPPKQITLDLDATDDPLHGHQEGRFFSRLL